MDSNLIKEKLNSRDIIWDKYKSSVSNEDKEFYLLQILYISNEIISLSLFNKNIN